MSVRHSQVCSSWHRADNVNVAIWMSKVVKMLVEHHCMCVLKLLARLKSLPNVDLLFLLPVELVRFCTKCLLFNSLLCEQQNHFRCNC